MIINLQTGPPILADGSTPALRGGRGGDAMISHLQARYFEQTFRGLRFSAANQAAQAVSAALATTYTGLLLYNPIGSGRIIVPDKLKFALSVAPAAIATIGIIQGFQTAAPTGLTAVAPRSNQIGNSATGVGLAYSAATIATPTWAFQLWDGFTAAALPAPQVPFDLEGIFVILPGGFIAIGALTAVTGLGAISWAELPMLP